MVFYIAAAWGLLVGGWSLLTLYRIAVWRTREGNVARTMLLATVLLVPSLLVMLPGGVGRAALELALLFAMLLVSGIAVLYAERLRDRLRSRRAR